MENGIIPGTGEFCGGWQVKSGWAVYIIAVSGPEMWSSIQHTHTHTGIENVLAEYGTCAPKDFQQSPVGGGRSVFWPYMFAFVYRQLGIFFFFLLFCFLGLTVF